MSFQTPVNTEGRIRSRYVLRKSVGVVRSTTNGAIIAAGTPSWLLYLDPIQSGSLVVKSHTINHAIPEQSSDETVIVKTTGNEKSTASPQRYHKYPTYPT